MKEDQAKARCKLWHSCMGASRIFATTKTSKASCNTSQLFKKLMYFKNGNIGFAFTNTTKFSDLCA